MAAICHLFLSLMYTKYQRYSMNETTLDVTRWTKRIEQFSWTKSFTQTRLQHPQSGLGFWHGQVFLQMISLNQSRLTDNEASSSEYLSRTATADSSHFCQWCYGFESICSKHTTTQIHYHTSAASLTKSKWQWKKTTLTHQLNPTGPPQTPLSLILRQNNRVLVNQPQTSINNGLC